MSEAEPEPRGIALLLDDWPAVSPTRENLLCPLVYDQFRNLAESLMSHERVDPTLECTGLVNEMFGQL